jgi:hypothetical protein
MLSRGPSVVVDEQVQWHEHHGVVIPSDCHRPGWGRSSETYGFLLINCEAEGERKETQQAL